MTLTCPNCQHCFEAEVSPGEFPVCPQCGQSVVIEEEPADEVAARLKEDELSALHIKAKATERRALIRQRGHLLIGVILCLGAGAQLVVSAVGLLRRPGGWQRPLLVDTLLFLVLYLLGLYLAWHLCRRWLRRASELKEQYSHSALSDPAAPPDYSALSDGSQHLRALDEMTQEPPPDAEDDAS